MFDVCGGDCDQGLIRESKGGVDGYLEYCTREIEDYRSCGMLVDDTRSITCFDVVVAWLCLAESAAEVRAVEIQPLISTLGEAATITRDWISERIYKVLRV